MPGAAVRITASTGQWLDSRPARPALIVTATSQDKAVLFTVAQVALELFSSRPSGGPDQFVHAQPKVVPRALLERYQKAAMKLASVEELEPGSWYAELPRPQFRGVWADGASREEALRALGEVLNEWLMLKIVDEDRDIPVVEGMNLNRL